MKKKKLLFLVTEDRYFVSHRLELAQAALAQGFDVGVATRVVSCGEQIKAAGITLFPFDWQRQSTGVLDNIRVLWRIYQLYRKERPDIVHHVAMKPVLLGGLVAHFAGVKTVVSAIAGMGHLFLSQSLAVKMVRVAISRLLPWLLNQPGSLVIVQNSDNAQQLTKIGILQNKIRLIPGAGVNVELFPFSSEPQIEPLLIVLPARMLASKGVNEFVAAAESIQQLPEWQGKVRFALVGDTDVANPSAIRPEQLQRWHEAGIIEWWGHCADMAGVYKQANIVCLPSYAEGMPKALLEAAACGRVLLTTDVPGCRDLVQDSVNGLVVAAKDSCALVKGLLELMNDQLLRKRMAESAYQSVLAHYQSNVIIAQTLGVYDECMVKKD